MNASSPTPSEAALKIRLALSIVLFLVAATLPYMWLIAHFGYDDIPREPGAVILTNFHAAGAPLVLAWFVFAMSRLLFIPVALGLQRLSAATGAPDRGAALLGVSSALAQAIGLLRWVLVVPTLADAYVNLQTAEPTRPCRAGWRWRA